MKVKAPVKQFEFSGHGDRTSLFDMIKNIKGDPKVLTVHGDENSCTKFAEEIQEKFGLDAYAPKLGEEISYRYQHTRNYQQRSGFLVGKLWK